MLLYEHLVELLLAVLAHHVHHFFVLNFFVYVSTFILSRLLLFFLLLDGVDCRTEVFRGSLPVFARLRLVKALSLGHAHLLFLLQLVLLHESGLSEVGNTCYLEVMRFA